MTPVRFIALALVLVGVFLLTKSCFGHDRYSWIMQNPETRHCCGPKDCEVVLPEHALRFDIITQQWTVRGNPVARDRIYPSQDQYVWVCWMDAVRRTLPRCLFLTGVS